MANDPLWKRGPHGSLDGPCPTCGHQPIALILRGMPAGPPDGMDEGYVVLGGCDIGVDDPTHVCGRCGTAFWPDGRVGPPDPTWGDPPPVARPKSSSKTKPRPKPRPRRRRSPQWEAEEEAMQVASQREGKVIVKYSVTAGSVGDEARPSQPLFITSFASIDPDQRDRRVETGDIVWTHDEFTDLVVSVLRALESEEPGGMARVVDRAREELGDQVADETADPSGSYLD